MLRIVLSLALAFALTAQAHAQQQSCQYFLAMFDSAGDGWSGGKVTLNADGQSTDLTLSAGKSDSLFINVPDSVSFTLRWTPGTSVQEVSFVLYDNLGDTVFASPKPLLAGQLFSGTIACATCRKPRNARIENVFDTRARFRWLTGGNAPVQDWLVIYGPQGFKLGSPDSDTLVTLTPKATVTGLQKKTAYDAYVVQRCDTSNVSGAVGPFSFVTYYSTDVGISAITTPQGACEIGLSKVTVRISNYGANPLSLIPFRYNVNGLDAGVTQPQDGLYTGVLGKDSSDVVEFDLQFNFEKPGEYEIAAFTEMPGDEDTSNDTLFYYVNNRLQPDYVQNFEKWDGGWAVDTSSKNSTWAFGTPDEFGLNGAFSGKNAWATGLDSPYKINEKSLLNSPCFDFSAVTADPAIQFRFSHDLEPEYDAAMLEYSFDNKTWQKLGKKGEGINWYNETNTEYNFGDVWSGNSDGWQFSRLKLTDMKGQSEVHFRFRMESDGFAVYSGLALDDVRIAVPKARDIIALGLRTQGSTTSKCGLEKDLVRFSLANIGSDTVKTCPVAYSINGGTPVVENPPFVINPEGETLYTFFAPFDSRDKLVQIKCWSMLPGEQNPADDTLTFTIDNRPLPVPLSENFDNSTEIPAQWLTEGFVTNGHNNQSNVLATLLAPFNIGFETDLPRYGYISAGDSLRFDYRLVNLDGTQPTQLFGGSKIEVQISDDCGDTYQTAYTINNASHTPSLTLRTINVGLDAYAGKAIYVRFLGTWGSGTFYFDLDNVNLRSCAPSLTLSATTKGASAGQNNGSATISVGTGNPPYTFAWSNGTTTTDPTLGGLALGDYVVSVTDSRGCFDTLALSIGVSAIRDIAGLTALTLQPNPTTGATLLQAEFEQPAEGQVSVLDMLGRPVAEIQFANATSLREMLDLGAHPAGLYLVRLRVGDAVTVRRLMRQ